jgi:hypothetical protein
MRVLVCGSRGWNYKKTIIDRLTRLPREAVVMHGGARGADALAGEIAEALGHRVEVFPADRS